jgi:PAS domain S-box-containing protein
MAVGLLDLNGTLARTSAAVFASDGGGRITLWNRSTAALMGYLAREVIGRPSCAVLHSEPEGGPTLCYRGCHPGVISLDAPVLNAEIRTRTKTGRLIRLDVSALVIPGPKDRGPTIMHLLREQMAPTAMLARTNGHGELVDQAGQEAALTRREIEVLRLMGTGMNTRVIANTLHISDATVRNHVQNVFGKLAVHSRLAAVAIAHRVGLLNGAYPGRAARR